MSILGKTFGAMARLRTVDSSGPGLRRVRRGRGFSYVGLSGNKITDEETLLRISALSIPPAWQQVWICPFASGHIQAVGIDAAGRKQYLYHAQWRVRRDQEKFDHMIEFASCLPAIREVTAEHLSRRGYGRERVLACAVRLLDKGFFRIGTEGYAEQNQTFGLATMRRRHVKLEPADLIAFDYRAKSGKRRVSSVVDPSVFKLVKALMDRDDPGKELLAYKSKSGWVDIKSQDINAYIKQISGGEYTAKDFRTWNATLLAAVAVAVSSEVAMTPSARKRAISRAVGEVAHYLGNTPAVSRSSYIDPRVFDRYNSGWTIAGVLGDLGDVAEFGEPSVHGRVEEAVMDLLHDERSEAIRAAA